MPALEEDEMTLTEDVESTEQVESKETTDVEDRLFVGRFDYGYVLLDFNSFSFLTQMKGTFIAE